jgi:hypothetical protein
MDAKRRDARSNGPQQERRAPVTARPVSAGQCQQPMPHGSLPISVLDPTGHSDVKQADAHPGAHSQVRGYMGQAMS